MGCFTTAKTTKKRDQCISKKQAEIEKLRVEIERLKNLSDSMGRDNRRLLRELDYHKHEIREMEGHFLERHRVVVATNEMLMESLVDYATRNPNPNFILSGVVK